MGGLFGGDIEPVQVAPDPDPDPRPSAGNSAGEEKQAASREAKKRQMAAYGRNQTVLAGDKAQQQSAGKSTILGG